MGRYLTVVIRVPDATEERRKVSNGLKLIAPFQTAMSLEDEMTVLELIEQHEDFEDYIADDARANAAELHAAAENRHDNTPIGILLGNSHKYRNPARRRDTINFST